MDKVEKPFYHYFYAADSYSCAVTGHKDVPSPSVCVRGQSCNRVTYDDRNICAFKGSTVNISCNYNSYESIKTKFWFRFDQSGYNTRPKDLSKDPQYAGRVQVFENERGGFSTLRISDLRERDSAEYHCKFTTGNYEWESSLPGTTLTVTDPDLQVQVIWSPAGPKLICHSSCLLVGRSFFVWYKNDTVIFGETSFSYGGKVDPADSYSCAHQRHRSPSVCEFTPQSHNFKLLHSPGSKLPKIQMTASVYLYLLHV
ncbi:uncharacterized protein LOC121939357 [Plectropomus leopardus]|uniref:uncharacterized protein LOC121939357 n=1 Tax=Plectropomus leopardus TaxID=160734 RepID=UPI001C4B9D1C|nr:uncharacterized protein LOC121939357 [Plectropomus leopardus]